MNQLTEQSAFRDWLLTHNLSSSAILLWHTLVIIKRNAGSEGEFGAPNPVVQQLPGMSKQSISNARNLLLEHQLIRYQPGKKGQAPVYELISLLDQSEDSSLNVDLQEEKETLKETVNRRRDGQDPFTIFEQNFGQLSSIAREKLIEWCAEMGDEMVVAAINLAIRNGGRTFNYIDKILLEWSRAKIETLEQLKAHEQGREHRKQTTTFSSQADSKKELFERLRKEKKS